MIYRNVRGLPLGRFDPDDPDLEIKLLLLDWVDSLPLPPKVAAERRQQIEDAAEKAHAAARERCQNVREAARPRRICRACWRSKAWSGFPADDNGQRTGRVCRRCVRLANERREA